MRPYQIGPYTIQSEMGRGSFGTVHYAIDTKLGREVAIKILSHQILHDQTIRARFEREVRTMAALQHPAIVPIYSYDELNGQPYFVMKLMKGGSLKERLQKGAMPHPEIARVLNRIAAALDVSHAKGIIHRDIKPANILFDEQGEVYLADFGVAKLTEATISLTQGGIIGSPAYMSPEQAQGRGQIDGTSDVYSLGAVLFEMLTGQTPYASDTTLGMAMAHVQEPVPSILEVKQDLPYRCEAIIKKAMAKEPAKRYQKASDLARDFQSAIQSPPSNFEPKRRSLAAYGSQITTVLWGIGGVIVVGYLTALAGAAIEGTPGGMGAYGGLLLGVLGWLLLFSRLRR